MAVSEKFLKVVLNRTGIGLNGQAGFDVQIEVNDPRFYRKVLTLGSLEVGESYMDGWWDCEQLDEATARLLRSRLAKLIIALNPKIISLALKSLFVNLAKPQQAYEIADKHYNLGNDLFELVLGKTVAYTCGYWKDAQSLDQAQIAKQDLICRKLNLQPGQRLLDIGCGWGGFAKQAAEDYGVEVVGITVSEEQAEYARKLCVGLPVEIRAQDYRELDEKFDYITAIGVIEHVGSKNYRRFMRVVERSLKEGGRFLLHCIGKNDPIPVPDPWINKYIFPNSVVPRRWLLKRSARELFHIWDWHEFGKYYDPTLLAWYKNFTAAWPRLKEKYGPMMDGKFYRAWRFYLLASAGAFRARKLKLWQILHSKQPKPDNYKKVR